MLLNINRKKVVFAFSAAVAVLVIAHCVWLYFYYRINDPSVWDFSRLLDLDYEGNIPTLLSSLLFIINGVFLYLLAKSYRHNNLSGAGYWLGLSVIFIFLGVDEGSRLHEEIGDIFENIVKAEGALYFPWVVPYVSALLVGVVIYFRFYLTLERRLQVRLFLAAAIFLGGAVGFEMLSAVQAEKLGTDSLNYSILYTIEETLEFTALVFLLDTLLEKLAKLQSNVQLNFQ